MRDLASHDNVRCRCFKNSLIKMLPLHRILYPSIQLNPEKVTAALKGKVILITGATFGIGEALTRKLMHYHVHLILVARTSEKLLSLKQESLSLPAEVGYCG